MKALTAFFLMLALSTPAFAGDTDPLFINLTSDDGHRSTMAISFGTKQQAKGHPLGLFLNDKAVFVASKAHSAKFAEQQKVLAEVIAKGGVVIVCPMCMKHFGVKEADLMPGFKVGNPDLTGAALFKDNTKTLTW
jgi:sulfur relay (sulfurtransferase) complex TusBCD TusD component (DsrE family)